MSSEVRNFHEKTLALFKEEKSRKLKRRNLSDEELKDVTMAIAGKKKLTVEQASFLKRANIKVDENGVAQVSKLVLTTGFGKVLKEKGIVYNCYNCDGNRPLPENAIPMEDLQKKIQSDIAFFYWQTLYLKYKICNEERYEKSFVKKFPTKLEAYRFVLPDDDIQNILKLHDLNSNDVILNNEEKIVNLLFGILDQYLSQRDFFLATGESGFYLFYEPLANSIPTK